MQTRHLQIPLPIGAKSFFDRLERSSFDDANALVAESAALTRDPTTVGRGRRIGHLAFCCLPQLLWMIILAGYMSFILPIQMSNPALNELNRCRRAGVALSSDLSRSTRATALWRGRCDQSWQRGGPAEGARASAGSMVTGLTCSGGTGHRTREPHDWTWLDDCSRVRLDALADWRCIRSPSSGLQPPG
jgi:hypothetical protein